MKESDIPFTGTQSAILTICTQSVDYGKNELCERLIASKAEFKGKIPDSIKIYHNQRMFEMKQKCNDDFKVSELFDRGMSPENPLIITISEGVLGLVHLATEIRFKAAFDYYQDIARLIIEYCISQLSEDIEKTINELYPSSKDIPFIFCGRLLWMRKDSISHDIV